MYFQLSFRPLLILITLVVLFLTTNFQSFAQTPFHRGVNFSNWFQANSVQQIQFSKFTKKDFEDVKSLGCDAIRLPINLRYMSNGSPNYTIDPTFYFFLDQVVDWAEETEIHLILDNHTFDFTADNASQNIGTISSKLWKQLAARYKNRSKFIYYEVLNEPFNISAQVWNGYQQNIINAIRTEDTKHSIVVGAINYNSFNDLKGLPYYTDTNLIYTFHFYEPFIFTHQSAEWPVPSLNDLINVPFPYNSLTMPAVPNSLKGTWIENSINDYKNAGKIAAVSHLLDTVVNFVNKRKVKVWCGEFGVYQKNAPSDDRAVWYEIVRKALEERGIAWTIWDYRGGFGLFNRDSDEQFEHDVNIKLVSLLGLNVPNQTTYVKLPDTKSFTLFDEYVPKGILGFANVSQGNASFLNKEGNGAGVYSLFLQNTNQYGGISFDFVPSKDLSLLAEQNFALDFWVKSTTPNLSFDVRFLANEKTSYNGIPWRMGYSINQTLANWNGEWQQIRLPLKDLQEKGGWKNAWYEPVGEFSWTDVSRFEIVAEESNWIGKSAWFDNIVVSDVKGTLLTKIYGNEKILPNWEVYPNPIKGEMNIAYSLDKSALVEITILNVLGQEVEHIFQKKRQEPGNYQQIWKNKHFAKGMYQVQLRLEHELLTKKIILE